MSDPTDNLRRGALQAGQKTAQIVIFVCMIAIVGVFLTAQPGSEEKTAASASLQPTETQRLSQAQPATPTATSRPDQTPIPTLTAGPTFTPAPTVTPGPHVPRIGIVAGHWWLGDDGVQSLDVGAVCDEGTPYELTEVEINLEVAKRVFFELTRAGYDADLLQEWDERLGGYRADLLVSIHADACLYPEASGFKVARVADSSVPEIEDRLVACLADSYAARTGLTFHEGSITDDMSHYHTFYEIDPDTPGVIIEVGFMLADRALLTQRPDLVAQGIIDGVLCFLEEEGKTLE
jgi:N-acetylmuramoyl-L-alanine amidase